MLRNELGISLTEFDEDEKKRRPTMCLHVKFSSVLTEPYLYSNKLSFFLPFIYGFRSAAKCEEPFLPTATIFAAENTER